MFRIGEENRIQPARSPPLSSSFIDVSVDVKKKKEKEKRAKYGDFQRF